MSTYTDKLILKVLDDLPANKAIASKAIAEDVNIPFTHKKVAATLRTLRKKGLVKKLMRDNWWLSDAYPRGYWTISDKGKKFLNDSIRR